jgi:hypothetical protein
LPAFPPAVGGLIFAARAAGLTLDAQWFDRVRATLPLTPAGDG